MLSGHRGPLQQQLPGARRGVRRSPHCIPDADRQPKRPRPLPFLELEYFNGVGGFTPDGREYAIYLAPGEPSAAPWVNVIANAKFGCVVTESGLGLHLVRKQPDQPADAMA